MGIDLTFERAAADAQAVPPNYRGTRNDTLQKRCKAKLCRPRRRFDVYRQRDAHQWKTKTRGIAHRQR